jgi:hypothetical protein
METKKVIKSRDIFWMNQVYKDWKLQKEKKGDLDNKDDACEPKIQPGKETFSE